MSKSTFKRLNKQVTDENFAKFLSENVSPKIIVDVIRKMISDGRIVWHMRGYDISFRVIEEE